jgi:uncharacterized protein YndB with AHSA1/START domain
MAEQIEVSDLIPASPERVYRAWLDGNEHAAMTGGSASAEDGVGGRFNVFDDYITGENVELTVGERIVQRWRSKDFPVDAPDSLLEIVLEDSDGGTRITLRHTEIPDGQSADYEQGWRDHYFTPMRRYFSTHAQRNGAPVEEGVAAAPPPEVDLGWEPAEEPRREDDIVEPFETPAPPRPKKAKKPAAKAKAKAKAKVKAKTKAKPGKGKKPIKTSQATGIKAKRSVKPAPKQTKTQKKAATKAAARSLKKKPAPKPPGKKKSKAKATKKGRR